MKHDYLYSRTRPGAGTPGVVLTKAYLVRRVALAAENLSEIIDTVY